MSGNEKRALDPALMWTAVAAVLIEGLAIHVLVSSRNLPLAICLDVVTLVAAAWLVFSQQRLRRKTRAPP